jgi:hypothetical protein
MVKQLFPWVLLFKLMPQPRMLSAIGFGNRALAVYGEIYQTWERAVIRWHRDQLRNLDHNYRMMEAQFDLVREREEAHDASIEPSDSSYPAMRDVLDR